jgi:hypothetical protein
MRLLALLLQYSLGKKQKIAYPKNHGIFFVSGSHRRSKRTPAAVCMQHAVRGTPASVCEVNSRQNKKPAQRPRRPSGGFPLCWHVCLLGRRRLRLYCGFFASAGAVSVFVCATVAAIDAAGTLRSTRRTRLPFRPSSGRMDRLLQGVALGDHSLRRKPMVGVVLYG